MLEGLGLGRGTAGPQGRGWQGLGRDLEFGQGWKGARSVHWSGREALEGCSVLGPRPFTGDLARRPQDSVSDSQNSAGGGCDQGTSRAGHSQVRVPPSPRGTGVAI